MNSEEEEEIKNDYTTFALEEEEIKNDYIISALTRKVGNTGREGDLGAA